jgi:hypothetical protein
MGASGTPARQATASDPVRMPLARSPLGGAFDVIPVVPPWVWTSTEIDFLSTASAAEVFSAVCAAAVEPPDTAPPTSIIATEVRIVLDSQRRRVSP